MKHGWKILAGSLALSMAVLMVACGGSGGGGSSTASTPAACVYDSTGACVAGVGSTGYMGDGNWSGRLMVNNLTAFQQFAYENGLCGGQDCAYISGYLNVQLFLQTGGCLPGPGTFSLQTFAQGYQGRTMTQRSDAYINSSANGFLINYTSTAGAYSQYPYQQTGNASSLGTLQINTQFTNANHSTLNIQLVYRGVQIASGQGAGQASYNATAAANGAQYCASGAYGTGYGYGSPYTNINYGYGYGYNGGYSYGGYYPYSVRR